MTLPVSVPFTFGSTTTQNSLVSLDTNFSTVYTAVNGIGNGTNSLSNAVSTATGSTTSRTFGAREADVVNVKDFGAVGDGVADDTTAIQAALNTGKNVVCPTGTFKVSAPLVCTVAGTSFIGAGRYLTKILQTTLTVGIYSDAGLKGCRLEKMTLGYPTQATAGTAMLMTGFYSGANDFLIDLPFIGLSATGTALAYSNSIGFNDFTVHNPKSIGLNLTYAYNTNVTNFYLSADDLVNSGQQGMLVMNHGQGHNISVGEVYQGVISHLINDIQFCRLFAVYFDSSAQGSLFTNSSAVESFGTWYSAGRSGGGYAGCVIGNSGGTDTSVGISFTGTQFINCGASGLLVWPGPAKTSLANCQAAANSVTAGANVKHGIEFATGASDFSIVSGAAGNIGFTGAGTQAYGVFINSGCSNYSIFGISLIGNGTGALVDGSASATGHISQCAGYITQNSGTTTVPIGQTTATISHGLPFTPNIQDISVSVTSSPVSSSVATIWVTAVGATTFQIATNAAVAGTALSVAWQVRSKGS